MLDGASLSAKDAAVKLMGPASKSREFGRGTLNLCVSIGDRYPGYWDHRLVTLTF